MYAADSTSLFKSVDGGANWRPMKPGMTTYGAVLPRIIVDRNNSNRLYALVRDATTLRMQLFVSIDGGAVWDVLDLRLADIRSLAVDTDNNTFYASTSLGVLKSDGDATNWTAINSGLANSIFALGIDPKNSGTVYAGTWGNGFFKSTD